MSRKRRRDRPEVGRSRDGVDVTLIRWMLAMTPAERPDTLQRHVNAIWSIRERNRQTGLSRDSEGPRRPPR